MSLEQQQRILELRGSFLREQERHQAQWRLLCQCMKQVRCFLDVGTLDIITSSL